MATDAKEFNQVYHDWSKRGVVMAAKVTFTMAALMLAAIGLSVADIPNLVGNWTGSFEGYVNNIGYTNATDALTLTISEQKGRLFTGNLSGNLSGLGKEVGGFSGVIALDNKTFYMAEYDMGYDVGTILSDDTIELLYLEDGKTGRVFIDEFHRVE